MRSILVLPFVALTFLCWGNYGPLMHHGTEGMGGGRLRPFVCVGLAYFLIAVVVPVLTLKSRGESGRWTMTGTFWSLMAGAVGAVGALGIILAFNFGGKPVYVMPLVFGCAPVVNTFVTMIMNRNLKEASSVFLTAVALVAVGAAGVMYFKPSPPKTDAHAEAEQPAEAEQAPRKPGERAAEAVGNVVLATLSIALTALCWGAYGPVLHKGQSKMEGSRLRPFLCVGLAYFFIAVMAPMAMLAVYNEPGSWLPDGSVAGFLWSMGAGAAGAVGALGIIMAFNFGGKPILVMPLVFGCAPIVNTFTTMSTQGTWDQITLPFYASLATVIAGAVGVLVFAPRGKPGKGGKPPKPPRRERAAEPARHSPAEPGGSLPATPLREEPSPAAAGPADSPEEGGGEGEEK